MSVSTILDTVWSGVKLSANPTEAFQSLNTLWNSVFNAETEIETEGVTLASTFATIRGMSWNCFLVPIQGATTAGANFMMIRFALRSFVEPEMHSPKDMVIHVISFVGSTAIGYNISESIGYADLPHLNPGYDSRCISLTASVTGTTIAALYCIYAQNRTEADRKAEKEESFFTKIFKKFA